MSAVSLGIRAQVLPSYKYCNDRKDSYVCPSSGKTDEEGRKASSYKVRLNTENAMRRGKPADYNRLGPFTVTHQLL